MSAPHTVPGAPAARPGRARRLPWLYRWGGGHNLLRRRRRLDW